MSRERLLAPCESSTSFGVNNASSSTNASYYCDAKPVPFKELEKATKKFRSGNLLHEGHSSNLYKGWLNEHTLTAAKPGTGIAVAVKKYCNQSITLNRFRRDSIDHSYLNQICHPNLVKLIAYCSDDNNLLLVYEFMSKGCLANHLFKRGNNLSIQLPWATRIKVAKGAARGLSFLHALEIPVVYGDFSTANILLDVEFNAKLCGLGFRRDCLTMNNAFRLKDTRSFAPEFCLTGASRKCDVYSFGVALLELLSGRRLANDLIRNERPFNKRKILRIVDPDMKGECSEDEANIVATIVLQCLNQDSKQRPTMAEVVIALDQLSHP